MKVCTVAERLYTRDTQIGAVNSGQAERVEFKLTSSAKVRIQIGSKSSSTAGWGINGNVSLSADSSTSVDYSWTNNIGNFTRLVFARYEYKYLHEQHYYGSHPTSTKYSVTPRRLVGSSSQYYWSNDSRNGMPAQDVLNDDYGASFTVTLGANTAKSYTTEDSFSLAVDIPTPVGTFSPGVSTAYGRAHEIKWSGTDRNIFVHHYDWDSRGREWYVTR